MSKDAYYFRHDSNASQDPKMIQLISVYDYRGYGWFWRIVELMREQSDYCLSLQGKYVYEAFGRLLNVCSTDVEQFINDCINEFQLFSSDGEKFWSKRLLDDMGVYESKRDKARKAGQISAEKRAKTAENTTKSNDRSTDAQRPFNNKIKVDYSKVNEIKGKEINKEPPISPLQGDASDLKKNKGGDEKVHRLEIGPTFEDFWEAYDKKRGSKEKVSKQWNAMSLKDKQTAMAMLPAYIASTPDKKFRKDPERYISNRVWEFEDLKEPQTVPINQQNFNQNAGQRRSMDGLKEAWGRRIASR